MARRSNREANIALGIGQLICLLLFVAMMVPGIRQMLLGFGVLLLSAVIVCAVVFVGVLVIRKTEQKHPFEGTELNAIVARPMEEQAYEAPHRVD